MNETIMLEHRDLEDIVSQVWTSLMAQETANAAPWESVASDVVAAGVAISGCWNGWVVVETSQQGALDLASTLFDLPRDEIAPSDLADALGEVANIVGGSVKSTLTGTAELSLPSVEHGPSTIAGLSEASLQVHAAWQSHPLRISVLDDNSKSMKEQS